MGGYSDNAVLAYHMGANAIVDQSVGNSDYMSGPSGGTTATVDGRIPLSILSVAILGMMVFYVMTRSKQAS